MLFLHVISFTFLSQPSANYVSSLVCNGSTCELKFSSLVGKSKRRHTQNLFLDEECVTMDSANTINHWSKVEILSATGYKP